MLSTSMSSVFAGTSWCPYVWSFSYLFFSSWLDNNQLFKQRWDPPSFCQPLQKPSLLPLLLLLQGWPGDSTNSRDMVLKNQDMCPFTSSSHINWLYFWKRISVKACLCLLCLSRVCHHSVHQAVVQCGCFLNVLKVFFRKWPCNNPRINFVI